jgi:flagellar L-ring protein precursor FlgH
MFGCSKQQKVSISPPPPPPEIKPEKPSPGSIFSGYENLFADPKAHSVGDIITVKVYEVLTGTGSSETKTSKDTSFDITVNKPKVLGHEVPGKTDNPVLQFSTSPKTSFSGKSSTKRKAKLIATISARVVKVYPNGDMYIVGEKIVRINDDFQILRISGIVRPSDLEPDNSVSSSKIANLYVEYNGKGYYAENQRPGWLARLLMKIWPF